jgi:4-hydroxybenzoate polyprenyltransferase
MEVSRFVDYEELGYTRTREFIIMNIPLKAIISSARPRHWIKNGMLFVPLFFSGQLFNMNLFGITVLSAISLSLLASSSYIVNDIVDRKEDRLHPYKKFRPVASRALSVETARDVAFLLLIAGLGLGALVNMRFFVIAIAFVVVHFGNVLVLRRIAVVDILALSAGHIMRVYGGVAATHVNISIWLTLAIVALSLLFAVGKRRIEFSLDESNKGKERWYVRYSEKLLDEYLAVFATASFISYSYFAFLANVGQSGLAVFSSVNSAFETPERKWMMITIPFVLYGIMRYVQLIYEARIQSLDTLLTTDKKLIATGCLWVASAFIVIYGIGTGS